MPIKFDCPHCQKPLAIKDELAGRKGSCPKCKQVIQVPTESAEPALAAAGVASSGHQVAPDPTSFQPAAPSVAAQPVVPQSFQIPARAASGAPTYEQVYAQVMGGFQGQFPQGEVTDKYRLAAIAGFGFLLLLPLVYCGLAAFLFWDAAAGGWISMYLLVLLLLLPPFAFLKPLLSGRGKDEQTRSITPQSDPLVFALVERICDTLGSPRPSRIDVDCTINASAHFRNGWQSLFGRDLVLTIGLPLAAGLTLQQLVGVLAHEFGHFSQQTGMRLTYIMRSINAWLASAVYDRDSWDDWLERAARSGSGNPIVHILRFYVWCARKVLWCVLMACHVLCGYLLRQMEFDADTYEVRMVGSETYNTTCRRLRLLEFAFAGAKADLNEFYREGRLADNLPRLIMNNVGQLPAEAREVIEKIIAETPTSVFESHPSDRDRIAAAIAQQQPGVFKSHFPATILFRDFDTASKAVTWDLYVNSFGSDLKPHELHPVEQLIAQQKMETQVDEACKRFFGNAFAPLRPVRMPSPQLQTVNDLGPLQERVVWLRQTVEAWRGKYRELYQQFDQWDTLAIHALQSLPLLRAGIRLKIDEEDKELPRLSSSFEANQLRQQAEYNLTALGQQMTGYEQLQGERLFLGLCMLYEESIAARVPDAYNMQLQAPQLLELVSIVSAQLANLLHLRNCHAVQAALLNNIEGNNQNQPLIEAIIDHNQKIYQHVWQLRGLFHTQHYPFDHAKGPMQISDYLLKMIPQSEEIGSVYEAGDDLLSNLMALYGRCLGRLCLIAETVEGTLGLPPIAQLPDAPKKK